MSIPIFETVALSHMFIPAIIFIIVIALWTIFAAVTQYMPIDAPLGIPHHTKILNNTDTTNKSSLSSVIAEIEAAATVSATVSGDSQREHVLIVIAHPDDECMFFAPSILVLGQRAHLHLLCLSNGDAEGLGRVREKELIASCQCLGIDAGRVTVVNHENLQDSMTIEWDKNLVLDIITHHITENAINAIITFDAYGITGHTNHRTLYHATLHGIKHNRVRIPVYTLTSVSVLRKYSSVIDTVVTWMCYASSKSIQTVHKQMVAGKPFTRLSVASPLQYLVARNAMFCHVSQLVWYRYLYLVFSRFMFVNVIEPIVVGDVESE